MPGGSVFVLEKNVAFRDGCSMWNNICIVFRKIIYSFVAFFRGNLRKAPV